MKLNRDEIMSLLQAVKNSEAKDVAGLRAEVVAHPSGENFLQTPIGELFASLNVGDLFDFFEWSKS